MTMEFANPKAGRVYIVTLRADEPSPLPVLSDEVIARQPPDVLLTPTSGEPEATGRTATARPSRRRRHRRLRSRRPVSDEQDKSRNCRGRAEAWHSALR